MNHFGLRGGHFNAALKEFASLLVLRPSGCSLMSGPFALSLNGALRKILETWGSRLTWTAQRQHAAQIIGGMESFFSSASILSSFETDSPIDEPDPDPNYVSPVDSSSQRTLPHRLDLVLHHGGVSGYVIQREGTVNTPAFEQEGIGEDGLEGICRYPD